VGDFRSFEARGVVCGAYSDPGSGMFRVEKVSELSMTNKSVHVAPEVFLGFGTSAISPLWISNILSILKDSHFGSPTF
jgi:hypothetical protein